MSLIEDMLIQKAVYWPLGSADSGGRDFDDYGQPVYATPVEIDCRWHDKNTELILADGTQTVSRSLVFVDRDVVLGGVLWLGELADVAYADDPKANDGAWEIIKFDKIPDMDGEEFVRKAFL
jgi:hypothetical protein